MTHTQKDNWFLIPIAPSMGLQSAWNLLWTWSKPQITVCGCACMHGFVCGARLRSRLHPFLLLTAVSHLA
jgi:hypothetical protein